MLALVILTAVLVSFKDKQKTQPPPADMSIKSAVQPIKEQVERSKWPRGFPADLPMEESALIMDNYILKTGKTQQSVRKFISRKSVEENFELYQNYLKNNNWPVVNSTETPDLKALVASKQELNGGLRINISKNQITQDVVVELTMSVSTQVSPVKK